MHKSTNILLFATLLLCLPFVASAQDSAIRQDNDTTAVRSRRIQRYNLQAERKVFIPKGNVMFGTWVGYNSLAGDNMNFLILKDMSMQGYTFNASPYIGGFIADNLAIGGRLRYSRYMGRLDNLDLSLGADLNIKLQDLYVINHSYEGDLFGRYYMPFGNSKIFGMFAEFGLQYKRTQGKNSTGSGKDLDGTYQLGHNIGLYVNPGICVFVNDFVAAEFGIGVLGFDYSWKDTTTNQVEKGSYRSAGANLNLNLLSVNIGVTFYL